MIIPNKNSNLKKLLHSLCATNQSMCKFWFQNVPFFLFQDEHIYFDIDCCCLLCGSVNATKFDYWKRWKR